MEALTTAQKKRWRIGFGIFLLVLWQLLAMAIGRSFILPTPVAVVQNIWENRYAIFVENLPATMEVVLIGGGLSILLGIGFALLMDASPNAAAAIYPVLTMTHTIPVMCIAPALVLWLGYSVQMRVLVVILSNFFTVTVDLFDGLQSTREDRTELLMTYGASRWQMFKILRFPSSLPYFFSAMRVAVPWSVVGAAVSEWLGAPKGLGTYSRNCMVNLDAAGLLAPLVVLTFIALGMNAILRVIENHVLTWRGEI